MQRSDVASVAVGLSINRCGDWLWEAPPILLLRCSGAND